MTFLRACAEGFAIPLALLYVWDALKRAIPYDSPNPPSDRGPYGPQNGDS